jgi:hypothetical protein
VALSTTITSYTISGLGNLGSAITYSGVDNVLVKMGSDQSCEVVITDTFTPINITMYTPNMVMTVGAPLMNGNDHVQSLITLQPNTDNDASNVCYGTLLVDHTNGTAVTSAIIDTDHITDISANGVIYYKSVCTMTVGLTSHKDIITIAGAPQNSNVTILTYDGNDDINIGSPTLANYHAIDNVYVDGGSGSDQYYLYFSGVTSSYTYIYDSSTEPVDRNQLYVHVS